MKKRMAHRPLVGLPQGRTVYDDDPMFDLTWKEWAKAIAGALLLTVLLVAVLFGLATVPAP